jgi:beta-N-acetylhexosaminidase
VYKRQDRLLVLVDQEGGRVQRLASPHWRTYPPAGAFARHHERAPEEALRFARLSAQAMALDLCELGINTDCAPVADIPVPGASDVIGDRAYGATPDAVAALARAVADGLLAGGVLPVLKHIPGHGRATSDSHFFLPVVKTGLDELRATDFAPFARLADLPVAMTAHVIFEAVDRENPATISKAAVGDIIRREIGFNGLLMTDDLSMRALSGAMADRASRAFAAGCDVALHCNGVMREMQAVAGASPPLAGESLARFDAAWSRLEPPSGLDRELAMAEVQEMLAARA